MSNFWDLLPASPWSGQPYPSTPDDFGSVPPVIAPAASHDMKPLGGILGPLFGAKPDSAAPSSAQSGTPYGLVPNNLPAEFRPPSFKGSGSPAFAPLAAPALPRAALQPGDPLRAPPWWVDTVGLDEPKANNAIADRWPSANNAVADRWLSSTHPSLLADSLRAITSAPLEPSAFPRRLQTPTLNEAKLDPADLTARIIRAESHGDPNATNGASSAAGLGQIVGGTWRGLIGRHRPELAVGRTDQELEALRFDPALNRQMTRAYAEDNAQTLKANGLPVTPARVYLMHFLGPGNALKVLLAPPDTPAASVVLAKALTANHDVLVPQSGPRTGAQMLEWASRKMGVPPEPWSSQ